MKAIQFTLIALSGILLAASACKQSADKKQEAQKTNKVTAAAGKEQYQKLIDSLEVQMKRDRDKPVNQGTAMLAMRCYDEFSSYYPDDAMSPEYLFKAGEIASALRFQQPAVNYLSRLISKYPNYKNTPYAVFMLAMVYDDQLKDTAKARVYYNMVIEQYPNSTLAKDAKASIGHLGKSVEQLIKEFEQKNKSVQ